jgi:uncharacterized surface protein with fasciclin (FAS1) repeats
MRKIRILLLAVLGLWIVQSCTKVVSVAPIRVPDNSEDTTHDVRKILDSIPQFSLFAYACGKAGITSGLQPNTFFTLFVPTDSAMQAAGLSRSGIDQLSVDSLTKIIRYHITYGALADTVLNDALVSVQQNCLLETTLFSPQGSRAQGYSTYRHSLYVKTYNGLLSVNGWVVGAGEAAIPASNGYLYTMNQVLTPPTKRISDIVFNRPEFSFYATAINTIDSIYNSINLQSNAIEDTLLFAVVNTEEGTDYPGLIYQPSASYPAVFAPTNTAFANAGLANEAAVKQWVLSTVRIDTIAYYPQYDYYETNPVPGNGNNGFNFVTIDSIMKSHFYLPATIYGSQTFTGMMCYNDLTKCPSINSGVLNKSGILPNPYTGTASFPPFNPKYHTTADGVLNIQWNAAGTNNAVIPLDKNQGVRSRSFWTMNGVVYATDQLFYQP